nr:MAG: hypothetical protein [uncultured archaeon]
MSEDMLTILNQSLDLVGKRELSETQLREFIKKAREHEKKEYINRRDMFNNKEIENEIDINNFPFHTDGYRVAIFIKLTDENIFTLRDDENNEIQVRQLYKKDKDGEYIKKDGELVPTERCLMRIKARRGFMSFFIGLSKVEAMDKEHYYVLVGGLTTQWKVANSDDDPKNYHKKKEDGIEYMNFPSFTLNVWQIGEVIRTKGGKIKIITPDCNWKEDEKKK